MFQFKTYKHKPTIINIAAGKLLKALSSVFAVLKLRTLVDVQKQRYQTFSACSFKQVSLHLPPVAGITKLIPNNSTKQKEDCRLNIDIRSQVSCFNSYGALQTNYEQYF